MRALTQREIFIAIALGFVVLVWILFSLGKSYQQKNEGLKDQQDLLIEKIYRQERLIAQAPHMKNLIESLTNHLGIASSDGVETASMVKIVEQVAGINNVHIVNLQPKRSEVQGQLKAFQIELTLDGQWAAITNFIQSLQQPPYLLDIQSLQLEKYSEATGSLRGVLVLKRWRVLSQN